jgi:hypothetical protein
MKTRRAAVESAEGAHPTRSSSAVECPSGQRGEGDDERIGRLQGADQPVICRDELTALLLRQGYIEAVVAADPRLRRDGHGMR